MNRGVNISRDAMDHKHSWHRSLRQHRQPPRFFVVCDCGETRQAILQEGDLHVFTTGKKGTTEPMKVYPVRLPRAPTKEERRKFQQMLQKPPK